MKTKTIKKKVTLKDYLAKRQTGTKQVKAKKAKIKRIIRKKKVSKKEAAENDKIREQVKKEFPPVNDLAALTAKASTVALHAHGSQKRKNGELYFKAHVEPVAVACSIYPEDVVVAYLHDVVEDTHVTLDKLKTLFPVWVTDSVDAITKQEDESYLAYLTRVSSNLIARRVKLQDLLHNMSDLDKTSHQFAKYQLAYHLLITAGPTVIV